MVRHRSRNSVHAFTWTLVLTVCLLGTASAGAAQDVRRIEVWGAPGLTVGAAEVTAAFHELYPDLEMEIVRVPDENALDEQFLTSIASGLTPDVITLNTTQTLAFARRGALLPLDEWMSKDGVSPDEWAPPVFEESVLNGSVYGLPITTDVRALFYNRDMFANAGLDPNHSPQTWDELRAYAGRLTLRDPSGGFEQVGFVPFMSQGNLYVFALENGAEFLSADGRQAKLNSPEVLEALQYVADLYEIADGLRAAHAFGNGDRFLNQQVAMRIQGNWRLNSNGEDPRASTFDWYAGYLPVPVERYNQEGRFADDTRFVTWSAGWRWAIPSMASDPAASWKAVKFLSTEGGHLANARGEFLVSQREGEIYVPRLTGHIASDRALARTYLSGLPPKYLELQMFMIDLLEVTRSRPKSPLQAELLRALEDAAEEALVENVSPTAALDNAQRLIQAQLDDYYAGE